MMMFIWLILPILCMIAVGVYLYRKVKGGVDCFLPDWTKKKRRILAVVIWAVLFVPAIRIYDVWFIILLHITAFLLLIDGIRLILRKVWKNRKHTVFWHKIYRSGIVAILLTAIVCGYGRYNIFHVVRTEYTVQVQKKLQNDYKIALLSDLHYGITMNGTQLQNVVERINQEHVDALVLAGDLVDENTSLAQMKEAFRILGKTDTRYGVYYVYGNHDQNNYARKPNYTKAQLAAMIKDSGIQILEDDTVTINQELTLIGRADRGDGKTDRKDITKLTSGLNPQNAWIVVDHQPVEYDKVKQAGCDMELSGHTHAGQIWPAGLLSSLFHLNELTYGEKNTGNLHAIVTSGIAGWGYPIRTEKHSEYVVINIVSK